MKWLLIPILFLTACATRPHTYAPPDASKLRASTARVSRAVDVAHTHAREAQKKVSEAATITKKVREETALIENVPPSVVEGLATLELRLDEARSSQILLEQALVEADQAKAEVEKDKTSYFGQAQRLADAASDERAERIKVEKKLSWYRWHFWLSWLVAGIGIILLAVIAFLKFTGRLVIAGMKL